MALRLLQSLVRADAYTQKIQMITHVRVHSRNTGCGCGCSTCSSVMQSLSHRLQDQQADVEGRMIVLDLEGLTCGYVCVLFEVHMLARRTHRTDMRTHKRMH